MLETIASHSLARIAVLGILFALVAAFSTYVLSHGFERFAARSKLRAIDSRGGPGDPSESLTRRRDSRWDELVDRIERVGLVLTDTKNDAIRAKLLAAGYNSPAAPQIYSLVRLALVVLLPTVSLLFVLNNGQEISLLKLYIIGSFTALFGLYAPTLFVNAKAERRREEIVNSFPSCLDLMLVCVEAGLGMEAALDRVGREMIQAHPRVSRLLISATLQLRAGAAREVALRKMADELGVEEVRSFATLLVQSDRLGTSIATTLRVYASEMRERRRMRAEEKAHRLPVLLSIPLVACLLPVMIGVLMLPAIIRVIRVLF